MSSINKPVLVLNKMWQPIRIIPAIRAMTLIFAGKASAIDSKFYAYNWEDWSKSPVAKDDSVIVTTRSDVKIPEIVVLSTYSKVFRKDIRLTKRNIKIRDGNRCQYTGKQMKDSDMDIDHVIPRAQGGKNEWPNMVLCSKEINRMKADRTPEQAGLKLIRKPKKPRVDSIFIDPRINAPESWKKFIKGSK